MQNPANIIVTVLFVLWFIGLIYTKFWIEANPDEAKQMGINPRC